MIINQLAQIWRSRQGRHDHKKVEMPTDHEYNTMSTIPDQNHPTGGAIRGPMFWFRDSPDDMVFHEDGMVVFEDGRITTSGPAQELEANLGPQITVRRLEAGRYLMPGMIDAHLHYSQMDVIARFGLQLLGWLERYTFPAEIKFSDPKHADFIANRFFDELLRNGTTTCATYPTVHPSSVDALFRAANKRSMRVICGKVMMDRNAPRELRDDPQSSYADSKKLLETWHGKGRLAYAVTPRFAPTSSEDQLEAAGALVREHPDVFVQTHLAENVNEIEWVKELFPKAPHYLGVYDHYGLVGERSLFGHCVHLSEPECALMAEHNGVAVLCPTSNVFIGSGLFDRAHLQQENRRVRVAWGSDIGGGFSYSMLRVATEGYNVMQLRGQKLFPFQAFWDLGPGAAAALGFSNHIGRLDPGYEADMVEIDTRSTPVMDRRTRESDSFQDLLFALLVLGDDRCIARTWVAGQLLYERDHR